MTQAQLTLTTSSCLSSWLFVVLCLYYLHVTARARTECGVCAVWRHSNSVKAYNWQHTCFVSTQVVPLARLLRVITSRYTYIGAL